MDDSNVSRAQRNAARAMDYSGGVCGDLLIGSGNDDGFNLLSGESAHPIDWNAERLKLREILIKLRAEQARRKK